MPGKPKSPKLPTFDARLFEPPAWAMDEMHRGTDRPSNVPAPGKEDPELVEEEEEEPVRDLSDLTAADLGIEEDGLGSVRFTVEELKKRAEVATGLKETGNKHFTARPQRLDQARDSYLAALENLPPCPPPGGSTAGKPEPPQSGITEVTDEEADKIEAELARAGDLERVAAEEEIRNCTKAVWGNLAAVYLAQGENKATVDACTKALEIDTQHTKALLRRATANERIGSWSSLTSAKEDYELLLPLLPTASRQQADVRRALASLPPRIAAQQEKEKDEMLGKLKELGNGILGRFGLSTDMFKFDQQPGGGYNLRFEQ